jgi:hypothetical protein
MPSVVHELFVQAVEDAIRTQLKALRRKLGRTAQFAQKVQLSGSTEILLVASDPSSKSRYGPDVSFWHDSAQYPGVIFEVAYSLEKTPSPVGRELYS